MKYSNKFHLDNVIINYLKYICIEIGKIYCIGFDIIYIDGDQVHFSIGAESKYSPSKVMQIIKSLISRKIFREYFEIKKSFLVVNSGVMEVIFELCLWYNFCCNKKLF